MRVMIGKGREWGCEVGDEVDGIIFVRVYYVKKK